METVATTRSISRLALLVAWAGMASGDPLSLAGAGADADLRPSPAEARALIERVIANQHRNDAALGEYERFERDVERTHHDQKQVEEEKTYRVVPTGTGTVRLLVEENGQPVKAEVYQKQLRDLEQALRWALDPKEPRQKQRVEKWEKRTRERAEMIDAVRVAFRASWLGREARNGRMICKLQLEPNPEFRPRSRSTELFGHVRATLWIDETAGQLARVEAEIIRNISFGGGILGKVYRGGRFAMEQAPVAEGVWLPTFYQLDFEGRKFLFGFDLDQTTTVSRYRRIGLP